MKPLSCGRCLNAIKHGRGRGLVVAWCHCLPRTTRQRIMEILAKSEVAMEVERDA